MTNTVFLEQFLGILIVAMILTALEVYSIVYIVFPKINGNIKKQLLKLKSKIEEQVPKQITEGITPIIRTLAKREQLYTSRANDYIKAIAFMFIVILVFLIFLTIYLIRNQYKLHGDKVQFMIFLKTFWWAFMTIAGIGYFQGFVCIIEGRSHQFCNTNSFAVVSEDWKQNENFQQIALQTGICDV